MTVSYVLIKTSNVWVISDYNVNKITVCAAAGEKAHWPIEREAQACGSAPIVSLFDLFILQLYANEGNNVRRWRLIPPWSAD